MALQAFFLPESLLADIDGTDKGFVLFDSDILVELINVVGKGLFHRELLHHTMFEANLACFQQISSFSFRAVCDLDVFREHIFVNKRSAACATVKEFVSVPLALVLSSFPQTRAHNGAILARPRNGLLVS